MNLLSNEQFENLNKENHFDGLFNPRQLISCQYYDENQFISEKPEDCEYFNILPPNIRSLPRHGRELVCFLNLLKTKFDILILTEIGAKNISMVVVSHILVMIWKTA